MDWDWFTYPAFLYGVAGAGFVLLLMAIGMLVADQIDQFWPVVIAMLLGVYLVGAFASAASIS